MALALPTANALAEVMPQSSPMNSPDFDCRIVVSTEPRSLARHRDAFILNECPSILSPEESDDDTPLSPITFRRNEEYERSRLSYVPPRPSSSPSSPNSTQSLSPVSPVIFSQQNLSTPSLAWTPPPVFPSAGTLSLALRLKRPLPPLPKVDTDDSAATDGSRQERTSANSWARSSPSSSNDRDSDSVVAFSPATSSQSPATSAPTSASSDSIGSSKAVEAFHLPDARPKFPPLTIPTRSQSTPLPQQLPPIGQPIMQPCISVTPASPGPHHNFPSFGTVIYDRKRSASATSIVLASPYDSPDRHRQSPSDSERSPDHDLDARGHDLSRSSSPVPSLSPSVASSTKSFAHAGKLTLKRIASRTRLFGRRTLSSASEPMWDDEDLGEETVVGHSSGSVSFDDKLLRPGERARPDTPSTLASNGSSVEKLSMDDPHGRPVNRLEIVEATLTPHGDIWETRELHDVIPKLRQLRAH